MNALTHANHAIKWGETHFEIEFKSFVVRIFIGLTEKKSEKQPSKVKD